jgi:hypothetical protein
MKQSLRLISLLFAAGLLASAQSAMPINPNTIDFVTIVTKRLDDLVSQGTPIFVTIGLNIVNGFGVSVFSLLLIRWAYQSYNHHHISFNPQPVLSFLFLIACVDTMLYYYATPIPGVGVSLSRVPADIARQISGFLDISAYDQLLSRIHDLVNNLEKPSGPLNLMGIFMYAVSFVNILVLQIVLFAVTIFGFVFYWLTAIVGPLFISFLLFPMLRQYFHSWFSVWLRFAFYRIAASCLVYLWSNVLVLVIDQFIGNDYSLRTVYGMAAPFAMLNLAIIVTALRIPHWVDNLFSGSASAGHGGLVPGIVSRIF